MSGVGAAMTAGWCPGRPPAERIARWLLDAPLLSHVDSVRYGHVKAVRPREAS